MIVRSLIIQISVIICSLTGAYAETDRSTALTHPTVDELHKKLNDLVQRVKADDEEKLRNSPGGLKDGKETSRASDEFRILLERGGKRVALDRDNPVVLEEIVLKISGNNITSVELKYEEASLRRQFFHRRSIKNDDARKTAYGHIRLYYHAEGDTPKEEILINLSAADRARLLSLYIDGLLRGIRELDDRILAGKKAAGRKMNSAINMGIKIR